jgi:PncC family amidohydrolase
LISDDNTIDDRGKELMIDDELAGLVDKAYGLLMEKGFKLAFAESATGGMLSKLFTDRSGASSCYNGSVTSYVNSVKHNVLGVSNDDLDKYGAVSAPVAEQMADGARKVLGADIALSVTGIAGPGGAEGKEEGLFYFGLSFHGENMTRREILNGTRDENRKSASRFVLTWLCDYLSRM